MLFRDIEGFDNIKSKLIASVKEERISHAQFFFGVDGGFNLALAIAYGQYINCKSPTDTDSCGECSSCLKYNKFAHPDLHFIFPTATNKSVSKHPSSDKFLGEWRELLSNKPFPSLMNWMNLLEVENKQVQINAEESNEIVKKLSLKAFEAEYKVVIIWHPEKMNNSASNKILKILEEPPKNTLFILVGSNTDYILPTIMSRVQMVKIGKSSNTEIINYLTKHFHLPEEHSKSLANLADGSINKAVEQIENVKEQDYYFSLFQNWMRHCYKVDVLSINEWVDEISKIGREKQKQFIIYALSFLRECVQLNYTGSDFNRVNSQEIKFGTKFAPFIHSGNIIELSELFNNLSYHIERNANPKIAFMSLSLKMCNALRKKENVFKPVSNS